MIHRQPAPAKTIIDRFNLSIQWNAYWYIMYKVITTGTNVFLYARCSTSLFCAWANINSIIFIVLLWTDLGFRKSIPRYLPEFLRTQSSYRKFLSVIMIGQASALIIAVAIVHYSITQLVLFLQLEVGSIPLLGCMLFIAQGFMALSRLLFHAHFWHKTYNSISSVMLWIETVITLYIIHTYHHAALLQALLVNKLFISCVSLGCAAVAYRHKYTDIMWNKDSLESTNATLLTNFYTHSAIMWITMVMKSLSERNFLLPAITRIAGPEVANTYKIANDGALLFQRIGLKIIGTADTSLFAYMSVTRNKKKLMHVAFKKLLSKIAALCLPLLGIFVCIVVIAYMNPAYNTIAFQTFCILTISYLIELWLLAYERILEVTYYYRALFFSYALYMLLLIILFVLYIYSLIGTLPLLMSICCVRLVSLLYMRYQALTRYALPSSYTVSRITMLLTTRIPIIGISAYLIMQHSTAMQTLIAHLIRYHKFYIS
jgi:hypothetical protein